MAGRYWRAAAPVAATNLRSATKETSALPRPKAKPDAGAALRFPRQSRILRSADFRKVYDQGVRLSSPLFAAFCLARTGPEATQGARLGLTVPRAVGKAVIRNRIKRRLREAFRLHRAAIGAEWDIVLNPRRAVVDATFAEIEQALAKVLAKVTT